MNEQDYNDIFSVLYAVAMLALTFAVAYYVKERQFQREAVLAGHAEWKTDKSGDAEFAWKKPGDK